MNQTAESDAKRAVIYARVSSEEQAYETKTSLDSQIESCSHYAKAQGWEIVRVVREEGVSGSKSLQQRPEGWKLHKLEYDVLIVAKLDRLTRNARAGLADVERLAERDISVVFVAEAIDTGTPAGRLFRTMLMAFAEFERETIRDRMMLGKFEAAARGSWTNGAVPFGYRWNPKTERLEADPHEAKMIKELFELREQGWTTRALTDYTHDRGHTISRATVQRILNRETYWRGYHENRMAPSGSGKPELFLYEADVIVEEPSWAANSGR